MPTTLRTPFVLTLAMLATLAPAAAAHEPAPETAPVQEHIEEDYVVHAPGEERRLGRESRLATREDAAAAAAQVEGDPDDVGRWGDLIEWPLVGIHIALMPDGEVLAYDSVGDRRTEFYTDPATNTKTRALSFDPEDGSINQMEAATGVNLFCSGLAHLADGTLFLAGGNKNEVLDGSNRTSIFDGVTESFSPTDPMAYERWYPSVTPLANGEMLITEGVAKQGDIHAVPAEVRGVNGEIRTLSNSVYGSNPDWPQGLYLPEYPWMDTGPDGRVFFSGPDPYLRSLDPSGAGQWRDLGTRDAQDRHYGSHVMYDIGQVLVSGGGRPPTATATTIDLSPAFPDPDPTGSMAQPRRQHNLTVLPDGSVLATGGLSTDFEHVDIGNGVYTAELWDPDTGQWTELAAEERTRQYHSTALLLPDGRVLSSGGGICGACEDNPDPSDPGVPGPEPEAYLEKNAQIFSPPYLFADDGSPAPRPSITAAPESLGFDETFEIGTPNPASIEKVALVRLGAVTHSVNMEQRYVPLDFQPTAGGVTATSPIDSNVAPPGYYMLFVVDEQGVPSVSRMVRMELPGEPSEPPEPPARADTDAPDTRIERGPKSRTTKRRATFRFSSNDPTAAFECSLDGKSFRPCSSPHRTRVGKGRHRFAVRAVDEAGNVDTSAARTRFKVIPRPRKGA